MKRSVVALLAMLASPALAQSPPLTGKAPDKDTSQGHHTTGGADPRETQGGERAAGARHQPNGQVAPPAAINSGVQVIAPERK